MLILVMATNASSPLRSPFKTVVFENGDGTIDPTKFVLKHPRNQIHPGVLTEFLNEALGPDVSAADPTKAHGYGQGYRYHRWVLTVAQIVCLNNHLLSFGTLDKLKSHFVELRTKFEPTTAPTKPKFTLVPLEETGEESDGEDDHNGDENEIDDEEN